MSGISRDDWLSALREAGITDDTHDPEAVTAAELAAMIGKTSVTAERHLKALAYAGRAVRTRKRVTLSDGRQFSCVAYRLLKSTDTKG